MKEKTEVTRRGFVGILAGGLGSFAKSAFALRGSSFPAENAQSAPSSFHSMRNSAGITVSIDSKTGKSTVRYKDQAWFGPAIASVQSGHRWFRSTDTVYAEAGFGQQGKLDLTGTRTGADADHTGAYDYVEMTWNVPGATIEFVTGFRLYKDQPALVFVQKFPKGFQAYASGDWTLPSVIFPQFIMERSTRRDLHSWVSGGMWEYRLAFGPASSLEGTVDLLLLTDDEAETVILSPFANYLTATQQTVPLASSSETSPTKAVINCGIEGLVEEIPAGFEHRHIMVVGRGIQETFRKWGDLLLSRSGKSRPSKYTGANMKYPVYWDDYGAYYREHDFKEQGYDNYEQIALGIRKDAREHGLRLGGFQMQDLDQLRTNQGLFEPRQDLFPHGLKWLHEQLDAPLEAYIAWLSPGGEYRKKYKYFETVPGDVPEHSMGDVFYSEEYWRDTAEKLSSWGAILLQHDFLSTYEGNAAMMAGIDKMDLYFRNMTKALQARGINMQYCMALPRNILQSTENPIAISLQGSLDHHIPVPEKDSAPATVGKDPDLDPYAWKHLIFTSAFYGAVGLWPSRDQIQTIADPNAYEDILLANLLGGEIQLGHRIGECDFSLVQKTYREGDGLILKPDRPIAPLEQCYRNGAAVGFTQSERNRRLWFYVLSFPNAGYAPSFSASELGLTEPCVVYSHDSGSATLVDPATPITLSASAKHEFFVLAPLLENGKTVIGDVSKFVTMAEMRIASVEEANKSVRVGVVSCQDHNPTITGYSSVSPLAVHVEDEVLEPVTSLVRLQNSQSGWFWDHQTKLWHVKVSFASAKGMETRAFELT